LSPTDAAKTDFRKGRRFKTAGPSACRKSLFASLSKFSELYKSSENLGFQWRRTPFLGFPRTPFLTVAENLPLYRQSPYIASAQKKCGSRRPRFRFLHIRTPAPAGTGRRIFHVFILHEIEKPPALFSAATFTKDEMRAKKLLTFGFHLAMMQPTKTQ
jgi:hypothetical protein